MPVNQSGNSSRITSGARSSRENSRRGTSCRPRCSSRLSTASPRPSSGKPSWSSKPRVGCRAFMGSECSSPTPRVLTREPVSSQPRITSYRSQAITCDNKVKSGRMTVLTREYRHATKPQVGRACRTHPQADRLGRAVARRQTAFNRPALPDSRRLRDRRAERDAYPQGGGACRRRAGRRRLRSSAERCGRAAIRGAARDLGKKVPLGGRHTKIYCWGHDWATVWSR